MRAVTAASIEVIVTVAAALVADTLTLGRPFGPKRKRSPGSKSIWMGCGRK
jgi:hypothetical protein